MPKITRGEITANQNYLRKWDHYQLDWMNSKEFQSGSKKPLLLPINVDIKGGNVHRTRIKVPQLETIVNAATQLTGMAGVSDAVQSYIDFFGDHDRNQSGTPPTPLDFAINCPVVHVFHLPRENWTFTDHTQYSVDNVPALCGSKEGPNDLFEILGTSPDGHSLFVMNHNWAPDNAFVQRLVAATTKEEASTAVLPEIGKFRMKYNLHVSITQTTQGEQMCTDIIIDPGSNSDGTRGGN